MPTPSNSIDRQLKQRNASRKALRGRIRIDDVMSGAGLRPAINELRYQTYDNELRYQTRMGDYDEDACV